jgi:Phage terminase large subunit
MSDLQKETDLSDKQSEAWWYLNDTTTNVVVYGGAAGGGKSFFGCLWHIDRRIRFPGTRGMVGRAKLSTLEQSTLITFFNVCTELGYRNNVDYVYNSQKHIISWRNGSLTILKDLFYYPSDPDFTSLGSTEYTDVFIDEITEITQKAYDIVNSRIRYKLSEHNLVPKLLATCNPAPGWVKEAFVSDPDGKAIELPDHVKFVTAKVTDNPDESFVKIYSQQLSRMHSEYDKARLLEGDWDVESTAINPFAFQFNEAKHTCDPLPYDRARQLHISIDFNLDPFCVTFHHIWRDTLIHWHIFDEAEIKPGSIPAMIDAIKMRYTPYLPSSRMTGDAMGKRGEIGERDNASLYTQLKRGLHLSDSQMVLPGNPTHENSRADCNYFLYHSAKENPDFDFKVYKNCKNTIRDLKSVQCDAFGAILKKDRKDLTQRADYMDTFRYACNTFLKAHIISHQKRKR